MAAEGSLSLELKEKLEAAYRNKEALKADVQKLQKEKEVAEGRLFDVTEQWLEEKEIAIVRKRKLEELEKKLSDSDRMNKLLAEAVKEHKQRGVKILAEKVKVELQKVRLERQLKEMAEEWQTEILRSSSRLRRLDVLGCAVVLLDCWL